MLSKPSLIQTMSKVLFMGLNSLFLGQKNNMVSEPGLITSMLKVLYQENHVFSWIGCVVFSFLKGIMLFTLLLSSPLLWSMNHGMSTKVWPPWRQMLLLVEVICCYLSFFWSIKNLHEAILSNDMTTVNLMEFTFLRLYYFVVVGYFYFTRVAMYFLSTITCWSSMWHRVISSEEILFYCSRSLICSACINIYLVSDILPLIFIVDFVGNFFIILFPTVLEYRLQQLLCQLQLPPKSLTKDFCFVFLFSSASNDRESSFVHMLMLHIFFLLFIPKRFTVEIVFSLMEAKVIICRIILSGMI